MDDLNKPEDENQDKKSDKLPAGNQKKPIQGGFDLSADDVRPDFSKETASETTAGKLNPDAAKQEQALNVEKITSDKSAVTHKPNMANQNQISSGNETTKTDSKTTPLEKKKESLKPLEFMYQQEKKVSKQKLLVKDGQTRREVSWVDHPIIQKVCYFLNFELSIAIVVIVAIVVSYSLSTILIFPTLKKHKKSIAEIKKNEQLIDRLQLQQKNRKRKKEKKETKKKVVNEYEKYTKSNMERFLISQSSLFDLYQLGVGEAQFANSGAQGVKIGRFRQYPYDLELEADYMNIGNFLNHLGSSEILAITNDFKLDQVQSSGKLKASIKLEVYFYEDK